MNYYNEHEPKTAAWLRELIEAGLIPAGVVDERSIVEVQPVDLVGFTQCHWFAGVAGWAEALRLAGIPAGLPLWTASCPCQPLSGAGKQRGAADERHLWPELYRLISECRPAICFGEQVDSPLGREWLDGVSLDLEELQYAVASAGLCAASVGAPHIRQRLYWVADAGQQREGRRLQRPGQSVGALAGRPSNEFGGSGSPSGLGITNGTGSQSGRQTSKAARYGRAVEPASDAGRLALANSGQCGGFADGKGRERDGAQAGRIEGDGQLESCGNISRLGDSSLPRSQGFSVIGDSRDERLAGMASLAGSWSDYEPIPCADGKARRIERGTFPLVAGLPKGVVPSGNPSLSEVQATAEARVMRLKAYGNAIVPPLAAEFITAYFEASAQLAPAPA